MSNDCVQGRNVVLLKKVGVTYYPIGCAVSCQFRFKNEIVGKTDVNAGLFAKKRVRISDCSASVNGVLKRTNDDGILSTFHFLEEGVRRTEGDYKFLFTDDDGVAKIVTFIGLVETVDISGETSSMAEFDLQLQGTGGFEMSDLSDPRSPGDENVESDWWNTVNGQSYISGLSQSGLSIVNKDILAVEIEGTGYDIVTGTPGNRECKYTASGRIDFYPTEVVFDGSQTAYVLWKDA